MSPTTEAGLPYPLPTDPVAEGAANIQALAQAVDQTYAGRAMGAPTVTSADGTVSVASNTIRDDVLGVFTFTGKAGHLYRAILDGFILNGTVAGDSYSIGIRNGGASTPSGTSPLVAASVAYVPAAGSTGRGTVTVALPFTATGTVTLAVTYNRRAGSGVMTPVGSRALYAVDLGYFPAAALAAAAAEGRVLDLAALGDDDEAGTGLEDWPFNGGIPEVEPVPDEEV